MILSENRRILPTARENTPICELKVSSTFAKIFEGH